MANIAIKGHETRGKEVIELLEMLGGNNETFALKGNDDALYYSINRDGVIFSRNTDDLKIDAFICFTLDEFYKKYPYKVGDKAQHKGSTSCGSVYVIEKMRWNVYEVSYTIYQIGKETNKCVVHEEDLQPYKETMEDDKTIPPYMDYDIRQESMEETNKDLCLFKIDLENAKASDEIEIILGDYEIEVCDGKAYAVKKKPVYPNNYIECVKILDCFLAGYIEGYNGDLLCKLQKLLICRNAYWKIAGEQMRLGKSWEPNFGKSILFSINYYLYENNLLLYKGEYDTSHNRILVFPTEEMRDTFYENFKNLIEECKELL